MPVKGVFTENQMMPQRSNLFASKVFTVKAGLGADPDILDYSLDTFRYVPEYGNDVEIGVGN